MSHFLVAATAAAGGELVGGQGTQKRGELCLECGAGGGYPLAQEVGAQNSRQLWLWLMMMMQQQQQQEVHNPSPP